MTQKYLDADGKEIVLGRLYVRTVAPAAGALQTFKSSNVHAHPTHQYRPYKFKYQESASDYIARTEYQTLWQRKVLDPTSKPTAFVVDLDGTIMSGAQRLDLIPPIEQQGDPRAWDAFNKACLKDTPLRDTMAMVDAMYHSGHIPLFITGRNDVAEDDTHTWLEGGFFWYRRGKFLLDMRGYDDSGKPVDVKVHKIQKLQERYDILFAIDDDPKICDALRHVGISCWQVRNWQESNQ